MRTNRIAAQTAITSAVVIALGALAIAPASASLPTPHRSAASAAASAADPPNPNAEPTGRIVWTRGGEEGLHLMTSRADGTDARALTDPQPDVVDIDADISPDGSLVVFDRERGDQVDIVVIGIDGSDERVVDFGCTSPCIDDVIPTWDPTGTQIYFTRVIDPQNELGWVAGLWAANLDGTGAHSITPAGLDPRFEDYGATFLPSGEMVFLRYDNVELVSALFRHDPDGVDHQLTDWAIDADIHDVSPATTGPSAGLVVFETYGHGAPDGVAQAIGTVPAYCATLEVCLARTRILTSTVIDEADPRQNFNPTWSSGGRSITYTAVTRGTPFWNAEIATMTWNGRLSHDLTSGPEFDFRPDWGPEPAQ